MISAFDVRTCARGVMRVAFICAAVLGTATPVPSLAHSGHDHGPLPSANASPASPRVTAASENYQLVGIVEGEVLVIYLDRHADNQPVTAAQLEVTIDDAVAVAEPQKNGTYEV